MSLIYYSLPVFSKKPSAFDKAYPHQFDYQYVDLQGSYDMDTGSGFNVNASFPVKSNLAIITDFIILLQRKTKAPYLQLAFNIIFSLKSFSEGLDIAIQAMLEESIITGDSASRSDLGMGLGTTFQLQLNDAWRTVTLVALSTTNTSSFSIGPSLLYQVNDSSY